MAVDLSPASSDGWRNFWRRGGIWFSLLILVVPTAPLAAMEVPLDNVKSCAGSSAHRSATSKQLRCDRPDLWKFAFPEASTLGQQPAIGSPVTVPRSEAEHAVEPLAEAVPPTMAEDATAPESSVQQVDVDPAIIEGSPVLQRWLEEVPNLAVDNVHDPAFRTRVRVGYAEFPSTDNTGGVYVGVQDVFVGRTPLTLSAEYATNGRGDRQIIGADAQYYLLPLGWYGNIAPVVGYRHIQTSAFESEGINVGLRVIFIPSRTGTADLSITQSWVAPGSAQEVGLTTFAAGYAIAEDFRIGTDIQIQNARDRQESHVGFLLEWML